MKSLHCVLSAPRRDRHRRPPLRDSARARNDSAASQILENSRSVSRAFVDARDAKIFAMAPCDASARASTASDAAAEADARSPGGKEAHSCVLTSSATIPRDVFSPPSLATVPSAYCAAERTISARAKCPASACVAARITAAKTSAGSVSIALYVAFSVETEFAE